MEKIRLQKFLSNNGVASRRKCEEYITQGKISVNNKIVTQLGIKVDPENDIIKFDNNVIKNNSQEKVYILLNKPIDYVTTVKEQFNRKTVLDLVNVKQRIVPVGRLDMYTSGALILTNDGEFVNKITHPKHEIDKTYNVTLKGNITNQEVTNLEKGVIIDENYKTKPAKVRILKNDIQKNICRIQITIHEGKNRQIRKMCNAIEKKVLALHRIKIGNITVKNLKIGSWRFLTNREIESLLK